MKNKDNELNLGFTLMELLIVIVLLGFLIVAGVASYTSSLKKSHDTKRKNDLRHIAVSLEAYNNDVGHYPLGNANGEMVGCSPDNATVCQWGSAFKDMHDTLFMVLLPGDANVTQRYFYVSDANGTYFQLYARLENTQDSDIPKNSSNQARYFPNFICGTGTSTVKCNYGVASSNSGLDTNVGYE
jgi:prepilin-type N-terminal cleavage/methylation domain-containing protein